MGRWGPLPKPLVFGLSTLLAHLFDVSTDRWILALVHPERRDSAALARAVDLAEALGLGLRVLSVEAPEPAASARAGRMTGPDPRVVLPAVGLAGGRAEVVTRRGDPARVAVAEAGFRGVELMVVGRSVRSWWSRRGPPLHARLAAVAPVPLVVVGAERRRAFPGRTQTPAARPESMVPVSMRRPPLRVISGGSPPARDEVG